MQQIDIEKLPTMKLDKRAKDKTGMKQGDLIFLKPAERKGSPPKIYWWAQCLKCGAVFKVRTDTQATCCHNCKKQGSSKKRRPLLDLTNKKFGRLTALYPIVNSNNNKIYWHCKCDCGKECDVITSSLTYGNTKSCGCQRRDHANFKKLKLDLVGQRFGHLTVLEETNQRQYGKVVWKCQCDCGNIVYLNTTRLTQGNDISCGCQKTSYGANGIKILLEKNSINYQKEYRFKDFADRIYDFAILNKDNEVIRLIEFDGEQHFRFSGGWNTPQQVKNCQQHDKEKNEYAIAHNIPLVRIPYWERDNITLNMLLGDEYLIEGFKEN